MQRRIRNRLAEIFIQGFDRAEAQVAIEILAFLLRQPGGGERESFEEALGRSGEQVRRALGLLAAPPVLIRRLHARDSAAPIGTGPEIGIDPALLEDGESIRERLASYLQTLLEARGEGQAPTEAAYGRARGAFNRGLYFEAHEILEQVWRPLPSGPLRLYLQGIIQVSVGLHHAGEGRSQGAVNQLRKGTEKLSRVLRKHPDPSATRFCDSVRRLRDALADPGTSRAAAGEAGAVRLEGGLPAAVRDAPPWGVLDRPGSPC
jgi:hypothetical protein